LTQYQYDVFLSHNSADKPLVRRVAESLKAAGLKVWFDEWNIDFGDDIYLSIEAGLNLSHSLALFISANALKSDWVDLERSTALFRDPKNSGRRFIPILLDNCNVPDTLRRYRYLDFRDASNLERAICQLIEVCRGRPLEQEVQAKNEEESLVHYAAAHIARYAKLIDRRHPITVKAVDCSGVVEDAFEKIISWLRASGSKRLAVLGDPGAGKTYLLRRLSSALSEQRDRTPVFINAGQLRHLCPTSRNELLAFTDPPVQLLNILDRKDVLLVIDGLDELIGPRLSDQAEYSDTLDAIGRLIPDNIQLIFSCRSSTFDATSGVVSAAFGRKQSQTTDTTEKAIQQALGRSSIASLDRITLSELTLQQARSYLSETLGNSASNQAASYVLEHLPRVPVILRLLQLALPNLSSASGRVDLDELYAVALRTWIFRDPVFAEQEPEQLWDELISRGELSDSINIERLVHAGLLSPLPRGGYAWSHYSIDEFFFSCSLFAEINQFDASTLASLNLIGSYNINRFVVPMCRRQLPANSSNSIQPVPTSRYRKFLEETGWRRSIGYGMHPSYMAQDGTGFVSGTVELRPEPDARPDIEGHEAPVCGISWYDAFAYCKWSGEQLPDSRQILIKSHPTQGMWYWCADWYEERKAHMAVVTSDGNVIAKAGLNPDVRHTKIALATLSMSRKDAI